MLNLDYLDTHHPMSPYYQAPKTTHYCSICGNGIYEGEEYLINDDGLYRHYECFISIRELLKWLGHEIHIMDNND